MGRNGYCRSKSMRWIKLKTSNSCPNDPKKGMNLVIATTRYRKIVVQAKLL